MTPEPTSLVSLEAVGINKHMTEKQRGWLLRKRQSPISPKNGLFKSQRGTILHAVPPASGSRLSALEEEMAHSPNEEILSAISECPSTLGAPTSTSYCPSSEHHETPIRLPPPKGSHRDASSRIGVWVDGVVHWNDGSSHGSDPSPELPSRSTSEACKRKPCLSVTIPPGDMQTYAHTIYQPRPHRPHSSIIPISSSVKPPIDRPHAPLRKISPVSQVSRSSTTSSYIGEDRSICSNRSSATSIEAPANVPEKDVHPTIRIVQSPDVENQASDVERTSRDDYAGLQWNPPVPRRSPPHPPGTQDRPMNSTTSTARSTELAVPREVARSFEDRASPTWSQAEHALQRELSLDHDDGHTGSSMGRTDLSNGSIRRSGSVREVMQPPSRAPTIPKRSRKRDWLTHVAYPASELQRRQSEMQLKTSGPAPDGRIPHKSASISVPTTLASRHSLPLPPKRSTRRPLSNMPPSDHSTRVCQDAVRSRREAIAAAMMPAASTEDVLLHILARLHSPRDLFRTAIMNKGMYRVFQENKIHLLRTVVFNESPAAWELREWSPPDTDEVGSDNTFSSTEPSASSYMRGYRCDMVVVSSLKRLILETCQSFLRRETVLALSMPTLPNSARFNDAFCRIWTFCQIFGGSKNREDDITGQMDWLRGGVLANNEDCIASTDPNMDFDLRSVLISPPACFAESNRGGLSAAQLFDMTEIWTCMTALLQTYHGRVGQARYYGVYDQCQVEEGDVENEAAILEEWTAYLLTLGPSVVLEMAQVYPAAGFALARDKEWTRWTPPMHNGSRSSFLKEPVAKSYEEQIIVAKQLQQDPREQFRKDASRRRVASLAAEIRVRRQSSAYKRLPLIDMSTERAMSMSSRRDSVSPTRGYQSRESSRRVSSAPMSLSNVARTAHDTGERAIRQLVTMGFEREMAIDALRITDRGDGLRPDRAIDLLLRQQE